MRRIARPSSRTQGKTTRVLSRIRDNDGGLPSLLWDAWTVEPEDRQAAAMRGITAQPLLLDNRPLMDRYRRYASPRAAPGCSGLASDGLRPRLLTSYPRKANRRREQILAYRRLLSATARSVPDTFLPDVRRFMRDAAEDEMTAKNCTAMTWPYRKTFVHAPRVNGQAATKPVYINQKI